MYVASSGGAQEKGKPGWNLVYHQNWLFSEFHPPLNANVLFRRFFVESRHVWPNSGFWCCVFLTLRITLMSIVFILTFLIWYSILTKLGPSTPNLRYLMDDSHIIVQWALHKLCTICWGKAHNMDIKVRKRVNKSVPLLGEGPFHRHKS
jgi:hypothetical protein